MDQNSSRRQFLQLSGVAGVTLLLPSLVSCKKEQAGTVNSENMGTGSSTQMQPGLPVVRPANWDPIVYNRDRGNQGAIPESYRDDINGPDGVKKHLGKHLPYLVQAQGIPAGMVGIMWGDPAKGYAKHPNAPQSAENPTGHWYNWIRIRKAADGQLQESESKYSGWPMAQPADSGKYAAKDGSDPAADGGRNTVYVAQLPSDVKPGDWVRVHAHCLTHGEYLDFLQIPMA